METSSRSGLTGFTTKSTAPAPHGGHGRFDVAVGGLHDDRGDAGGLRLQGDMREYRHAVGAEA